ncbi:MAG: hypothetical protein ACRBC3_10785 [Burkholderiaceae bacterium]
MKIRFIQLCLLAAVVLFVSGASWVLTHSFASGDYDDKGIAATFRTVPDEQNLFDALQYIEAEGFRFVKNESESLALKQFVTGTHWNQDAVDGLLASHADRITDLGDAISRPYFQSGPAEWGPKAYAPKYNEYLTLNDLLLLKASSQQRSRQYDQAVASLTRSMTFANRLQHDENGSLVAHVVGLTMLESTLQWLERAVQTGDLNNQQLDQIAQALAALPGFDRDGFRKTLMSEFMTTKALVASLNEQLLEQTRGEPAAGEPDNQLEAASRVGTQVSSAFSFLLAAGLSNYLLQPDELLAQRAAEIQELILLSELPCQAVSFPTHEHEGSSWDIFKPGGLLKNMLLVGTNSYQRYFERRCLSHTQVQSLQALVAVQRYERAEAALPEHLRRLVPEYLAQEPRDWFNGQSLKFNKLNGWIYSAGLNYRDEAGNKEAILAARCGTNPACMNEPTFALRASPAPGS